MPLQNNIQKNVDVCHCLIRFTINFSESRTYVTVSRKMDHSSQKLIIHYGLLKRWSQHIEFLTNTVDTTLIPYLSSRARAQSIPCTRKPLRGFKEGHIAGRVQTPLVHGYRIASLLRPPPLFSGEITVKGNFISITRPPRGLLEPVCRTAVRQVYACCKCRRVVFVYQACRK